MTNLLPSLSAPVVRRSSSVAQAGGRAVVASIIGCKKMGPFKCCAPFAGVEAQSVEPSILGCKSIGPFKCCAPFAGVEAQGLFDPIVPFGSVDASMILDPIIPFAGAGAE